MIEDKIKDLELQIKKLIDTNTHLKQRLKIYIQNIEQDEYNQSILSKQRMNHNYNIYENINLGQGASSDVNLVTNEKNLQLSIKLSRKVNKAKSFFDSEKKVTWIKNEEDSYSTRKTQLQ